MRSLCLSVLLISNVLFGAGFSGSDTSVDPTYLRAYDEWKAEQVADLKANWLPLAGLFWLKPGENNFGADPGNAIELPAGSAPAHSGTFILESDRVTVRLNHGTNASIAS